MSDKPSHLGPNSIVEATPRPCLGDLAAPNDDSVSFFGDGVWVGSNCILHRGIRVGERSIIDDGCLVESGVSIGSGTLLTYRAHVCEGVSIGNDCVIGGFIGERATVKDHSRVFGSIVHHHTDPTRPWDAPSSMEPAATIHEHVMIGFGVLITRDVSIGPNAYVCAGATISRDVPPMSIAFGLNKICRFDRWNGTLRNSPIFFPEHS